MINFFKYKIETKEIVLIKPTKWSLGSLEKINAKRGLSNYEFIKYVMYYSQKDTKENNSFTFMEFSKLHSNIIGNLFISYINSDINFLTKYNENKKVNNIESAVLFVNNHIDYFVNDMGFLLVGTYFSTIFFNSWLNSIKGNLTKENLKKLDDCCELVLNTYNSKPEYFEKHDSVIEFVNSFVENKKYFYELFSKVNLIIDKTNKSGIWIPSRYSQKIFDMLLPNDINRIERINIEEMIYDLAEKDINNIYLQSWLEAEIMRDRKKILEEAFETHKKNLFAPAICFFLTQLDFVILQISQLLHLDDNARNVNTKIINKISNYIENEIILDTNLTEFFPENCKFDSVIYYFQAKSLSQYLNRITFSDTEKIENDILLNRHGILHGKFVKYANENNSKKVILLIDELLCFYQKLKKVNY